MVLLRVLLITPGVGTHTRRFSRHTVSETSLRIELTMWQHLIVLFRLLFEFILDVGM